MRVAEKTGKTVEEAITAGVLELGVDRKGIKVEVLAEPTKKGLFGLFGTSLANRLAEKVKKTGMRIVLEPMNPHERRIIHTSLQDEARISTFSEGDDLNRHVVISLKRV